MCIRDRRQPQSLTDLVGRRLPRPAEVTVQLETQFALGLVGVGGEEGPGPVSYTHLDVYKRQQWYHEIAELGYPDPIPTDPVTGKVVQNPWAFYPMFPMLSRLVMRATGANFYVAGALLSTVVGAIAVVLMFRLVDRAAGRWSAIVATVATSTWVAALVLQTDYSEACLLYTSRCV